MDSTSFTILNWSAWAPGLETKTDWQTWAKSKQDQLSCDPDCDTAPKLAFIKPMLRRRFSRLTRMALQTAFDCLSSYPSCSDHTIRTVFCSRHGEIHRTKLLLDDIIKQDAISPMGFSLSVHNTASGLYSIASGNQAPSSAIAAGSDTLEMAVIDALGHLHREPSQAILLVLADEPLPEFYQSYDHENAQPYSVALLLGANSHPGAKTSNLHALSAQAKQVSAEPTKQLPHGLQLLRYLLSDKPSCLLQGERLAWNWSKGGQESLHAVST